MIRDAFDRVHDYLRISLTDNCNLRCFYCMPEEDYAFTPASRLMQTNEIASIAKLFVQEGVKKIRLTGGEPLVRKDAAEIILSLSKLPVELTLTTNATRLDEFQPILKEAGIRSINVSLDSLKAERFNKITRRNLFDKVKSNIDGAIEDFHVKVNVVVMKGVNEDEINDFIRWTKDIPVHIRFIEFMPFSGNQWTSNKVVTWNQMLSVIEEEYSYIRLQDAVHDTAKKYMVPGHKGSFAFISTMSANFCGDCNRMRLTADGKMKNCLFSKEETDLLTAFRSSENIIPLIHQCIGKKAKELGGQLLPDFEKLQAESITNRSMISIGG